MECDMEMIKVSSSAIAAVGYDPARQRMKILFAQGHIYDFCRVPPTVFEEFLGAGSKGTYYNRCIKDRYPCH
jgi:hypothetical protein